MTSQGSSPVPLQCVHSAWGEILPPSQTVHGSSPTPPKQVEQELELWVTAAFTRSGMNGKKPRSEVVSIARVRNRDRKVLRVFVVVMVVLLFNIVFFLTF